ncbi:MAG: alpha/beta hydrolase [Candidatus Omnitrophica bacterium]|nr:alpha/beta hydrolase [Candidatus Omnitrophota bacterium]
MKLEEGFFTTYDGTKLFFRAWLAENLDHPVFFMHGLHEHSGRYDSIVKKLDLPHFSYFSFDQRGHGLSEGERGYGLGIDQFVTDMEVFWEFVITRWPMVPKRNIIWIGHSFGGLWSLRYAIKHPEHIKALVLSSPCLGIKTWVPYLEWAFAWLATPFPKSGMHSFVFHDLLSHDPEERQLHREDRLIHNRIGFVLLRDSLIAMPETVRRAPEIKMPLLVLISGEDYVVKAGESLKFFENAGSLEKEKYLFPGFFHELIREKDWRKPISLMRDFLLKYSHD